MPEPTDPTNPLSHFDPEVPMPLSAADIRRRGDRLRRRNAGLAVAGGVAVIALIAAPLAVLNGSDDTDALPPTAPPTSAVDPTDPAPSRTPSQQAPSDLVTTIPDDFPLAAGLPETNSESGEPTDVVRGGRTTDFPLCQDAGFDPVTPSALTDLASVSYLAPEDGRQRLLTVWEDVDGAAAALADVRDTLGGCEPTGARYVEETSSYGPESVVFAVQYSAFGDFSQGDELAVGLTIIEAFQVCNALYLSRYDNEGGSDPEGRAGGVRRSAEQSDPAVAAMYDVFSGEGDTGPSEDGGTSTPQAQAALLALEDLPDRERLGAWAQASDDSTTWACGPADLFTGLDAQASSAARYAASGADDDGGPAIARLRTAVLQFSPEDDDPERAYDALQDNLAFCAEDEADVEALAVGGFLPGIGDDASFGAFTYAASDICTDCDAVWFDRMAVARIGNRVVVVSYAEVGGPLQPAGLDQVLRDVLSRAVDLA